MSITETFCKEKPVFTGIARGMVVSLLVQSTESAWPYPVPFL